MKKFVIARSLILSSILASITTLVCWIAEAHKNVKKLSEVGFYSVIFCLALVLFSVVIIYSEFLIYNYYMDLNKEMAKKLNIVLEQTNIQKENTLELIDEVKSAINPPSRGRRLSAIAEFAREVTIRRAVRVGEDGDEVRSELLESDIKHKNRKIKYIT